RLRDNALVEYKMKLEKEETERDQLNLTLKKFQNSSKSLNELLESQVIDKFKTGLGYNAATPVVESFVKSSEILENGKTRSVNGFHAVPPPLSGNFIPSKPDLIFMDEIVESENMDVTTVVTPSNGKKVDSNHESANKGDAVEPKTIRMNNSSAPIIEDWNSDDDSEVDYSHNDKTVRPSTEKIKSIKTVRETEAPKQNKHYPKGDQRNWNNLMSQRPGSDFKMINKACFVYGSFEHLHYVCDKKVVRPVWNNSSRVNHKNFTNKLTHPHPKRSFVPQAVLTRSGKINTAGAEVNTVRPVNTAITKAVNTVRTVNTANSRPVNTVISTPINNIVNKNVNTARVKDTTARERAVGNPQQKEYKEKGVINSGCSRHMTGNKCYLTKYEDYDGGFLSFRDGKGRISRKGKIKTGTLDFDDVHFCKELKYNLFSVLQICDKKNSVLFTDTKCLVLSSDFKLLDESQVLLSVPRKDNIYSVDLKSVVPTGGLTCLFAKATIDESNIWHRRLGHINFKTMNKLVKENLVKGIKREFSVARTPQQNGVAERKNKTLIEAARTMDHLGKFDGKADEGYFVRYYVVSKAMRVFNKRNMIVEETLNIRFLENAPNVKGNGPDLIFDVNSLTISMNYVPVVTRNETNGIAGNKDNIVAGQAEKKKEPEQEYILIPLCITDPLISQDPKNSKENAGKKPTEKDEGGASDNDI
ncbi:ribonuclease H-like domain-containing protein, partial [Tanacetum coccineum]